MNILYVANARMPTEKAHGLQIMKTCEALTAEGHALTLIVPRRRNSIRTDPFDYWRIAARFPMRRLFTLDLIRFGRLGFLVQASTFALAAAFALPRRYDALYGRDEVVLCILVLFGFRRVFWESHDGAWNWCARIVAHRAEKLVVVSEGLREWYIEKGIAPEKITVVPNAIDLAAFAHPETKEVSRQRLHMPQDKKIALYIGRLDGWKGTGTLLDASQHFDTGVQLVMIGGDPEQVQELRKRYSHVIFLGYRPYDELPDNQAAADVLVVPNTGKSEIGARFTSPLKLIAHLASGRPIVASDLPSIREIAGEDAALLVPADDAKALAEGIKRVLADASLAEGLVRHARERVTHYSWEARARAITDLLKHDVWTEEK